MKRIFCIILLIISSISIFSQSPKKIDIAAEYMAVDPQGNLYLVQDATLYKYNLNGELLGSYTNNMLGHITSIDVDNPFKIMLFYREDGSIIFLDGQLASIGNEISLYYNGLNTISLASYSSNNNLHLYDETNTELIIMDLHSNIKERIRYDFEDFHPEEIIDKGEQMMVMRDPQGIYFFDQFGTFEKSIALQSEHKIQLVKSKIYYVQDHRLKCYNIEHLDFTDLLPVHSECVQALLYGDKMIQLIKDKGVMIDYSF